MTVTALEQVENRMQRIIEAHRGEWVVKPLGTVEAHLYHKEETRRGNTKLQNVWCKIPRKKRTTVDNPVSSSMRKRAGPGAGCCPSQQGWAGTHTKMADLPPERKI